MIGQTYRTADTTLMSTSACKDTILTMKHNVPTLEQHPLTYQSTGTPHEHERLEQYQTKAH